MNLQELLMVIVDRKVTIYARSEDDDGYINLYIGSPRKVPEALQCRNVRIIGARGEEHLDIQVE